MFGAAAIAAVLSVKKINENRSTAAQLLRRKMREKNSIVGTSSAVRNAVR